MAELPITEHEEEELIVERRGAILILKMNRPARRNALSPSLRRKLFDYAVEADTDESIRVGVLASARPGLFSAGNDLIQMGAGGGLASLKGKIHPSFSEQPKAKPWIAAVSGPAIGGGLEMALACDMRVASETAVFGLPETTRGFFAGAGGPFRLMRAIPTAVAMQMMLADRRLNAERAFALGLVGEITAGDDALPAALSLAEAVAAAAPLAIEETLKLARAAFDCSDGDLWKMTKVAFARNSASNDAAEGVRAFIEKRSPCWSGS